MSFTIRETESTPQLDRAIEAMRLENLRRLVAEFVALVGEIGDRLVPVRTGALKASRKPVFTDEGLSGGQVWGEGLTYARFVHDGTIYMPARPWALMALVQAQKQFRARVALAMAGRE